MPLLKEHSYIQLSVDAYSELLSSGEDWLQEYYDTAGGWWMMSCPEECVGNINLQNVMNNLFMDEIDGETYYFADIDIISECDFGFLDYLGLEYGVEYDTYDPGLVVVLNSHQGSAGF
jgi:hypothetical protein